MTTKRVIIQEDAETGEAKVSHEGFSSDFEALGWIQTNADTNMITNEIRGRINTSIREKRKVRDDKVAAAEAARVAAADAALAAQEKAKK